MPSIALLLTTAGSEDEAAKIARELVERRLAACVNVVSGVASTYRWKGAVETASEWLLVIKTLPDRFDDVQAALGELHSYELPELVMIDPERVDPRYAGWIVQSL
jgi:periplasmic divalent cation tolerance protein